MWSSSGSPVWVASNVLDAVPSCLQWCFPRCSAPSDKPKQQPKQSRKRRRVTMPLGARMAWERKVSGAQTGTGLTFGDLLRRHRASSNVTQEDLAERSGLTPQAIGLLERGKRRRPHAYTVQKLAEALQ